MLVKDVVKLLLMHPQDIECEVWDEGEDDFVPVRDVFWEDGTSAVHILPTPALDPKDAEAQVIRVTRELLGYPNYESILVRFKAGNEHMAFVVAGAVFDDLGRKQYRMLPINEIQAIVTKEMRRMTAEPIFKKIYMGDEWGSQWLAPFNEDGSVPAKSAAIRFQEFDEVTIRWPAGKVERVTLRPKLFLGRVGDHGRDYDVRDHRMGFETMLNGLTHWISLAGVEVSEEDLVRIAATKRVPAVVLCKQCEKPIGSDTERTGFCSHECWSAAIVKESAQ